MPRFGIYGKFTPEALASVRAAGYATRDANAGRVWKRLGGELEHYYWLPSAEYDFLQIGTARSHDAGFAILAFGVSSGAFVRGDCVELRTGAEADAASALLADVIYEPPGSATS